MTVGIVREAAVGERRVALIPAALGLLLKAGLEILVESGAGEGAFHTDAHYKEKGARIVARDAAWGADIVTVVNPPREKEMALLKSGSVLIGFLKPLDAPEIAVRLADRGVTALAMELVPRISRAQKMDALSAMASVAGYRAAIKGAELLPKFFPLLTTAAGTVRPANVLILGAGVAGLQAIATARRLGARVWGYDIRDTARDEVRSLGAQFVELDLEISDVEDAGGYAKALKEEKVRRQTELLVPHIARADVVITTAQIPGKKAPLLITEGAVLAMRPGSVIIDLAGGNCALTVPGKTVVKNGVQILGLLDLAATMPIHSSQLYARTVAAMIEAFMHNGRYTPDFDDAVFKGACVTHGGRVVHERLIARNV